MKFFMRSVLVLLALSMLMLCSCSSDGTTETTTTEPNESVTDSPDATTAEQSSVTTVPNNGKLTYTVTVKDSDGNAIEGAMVQLCEYKPDGSTGSCFMPVPTGADGVMTRSLAQGSYYASFPEGVAGYVTEGLKFYFEDGATELEIKLDKAS